MICKCLLTSFMVDIQTINDSLSKRGPALYSKSSRKNVQPYQGVWRVGSTWQHELRTGDGTLKLIFHKFF